MSIQWQRFDRKGATSLEPHAPSVRVLRGGAVLLSRSLGKKFKQPLQSVAFYYFDNGDTLTVGVALLTDNAGQYKVVTNGGRIEFGMAGFFKQMGIAQRPATWYPVTASTDGVVNFYFTLDKKGKG